MSDQQDFGGRRVPAVRASGGYHIHNSPGTVIGDGSSSHVNVQEPLAQDDVIKLLDKLISVLPQYHAVIDDPAGVAESAQMAREEITSPSPKLGAVRSLLKGIAAGVTGVSALTGLINNILALIPK